MFTNSTEIGDIICDGCGYKLAHNVPPDSDYHHLCELCKRTAITFSVDGREFTLKAGDKVKFGVADTVKEGTITFVHRHCDGAKYQSTDDIEVATVADEEWFILARELVVEPGSRHFCWTQVVSC